MKVIGDNLTKFQYDTGKKPKEICAAMNISKSNYYNRKVPVKFLFRLKPRTKQEHNSERDKKRCNNIKKCMNAEIHS